jgi:hypothetical protein
MAALLGPGGARNRRGLRESGTKESGQATKARWEGKPGMWLTGPPCPGSHRAASCGLPRFSFPPRQARPRPSSQAPDSRRPRQPGKFRVSQGNLARLRASDQRRVTSLLRPPSRLALLAPNAASGDCGLACRQSGKGSPPARWGWAPGRAYFGYFIPTGYLNRSDAGLQRHV